jgi:hypothetical protein
VDLPARFRGCCALPGEVTFENHGAMEDVSTEGEVQVFACVRFEAQWLHGGEFVDGS